MLIADMTYLPIPFLPNSIHFTELYTVHCIVYCTLTFKKNLCFTEVLSIISNSSGGLLLFGTFICVTNVVCTVYSSLYITVYNLVNCKLLSTVYANVLGHLKKGQERKYILV